ncbi:hypothetical protein [Pseudacidovorax sp. RU35E]|uniref:hypothetical protein n=1 Tax=Pseudacidovorax sp. RU35E TaxID=1907403 RepID=UPI00095533E0|nr:hypothetical protein [Pseudacidovorax sp. RU35E]SIR05830.1 hypothetical protein SAMN05880557_107274 [Pseudacidovorax sp. RU35E]
MPAIHIERPRLAWIKRRARRLMRFYGIDRRMAIADAHRDYIDFVLPGGAHLTAVRGGRL